MSSLVEAADTIERLAIQYQGMVLAAETLKKIGSIENHLAELSTSRDAALSEQASLLAQIQAAHASVSRAEQAHDERLKELEEQYAVRHNELEAESITIIEQAQTKAQAILDLAKEGLQAQLSDLTASVESAKLHLGELNHQIEITKAEAHAADASRAAAQAGLDAIQAQIHSLAGH
jgi:chromosome segregation ATPase